MDFENIREDFSNVPVLLFCGGKGKRMGNLAYKHILPSKEWLPIFDESNKPVPLFWPIFEIFLELGFKEIYILISGEGEKVKRYFEEEFKDKNVNVQLLNKENLLERVKVEGINIYIFENNEEGTGTQILALEKAINNIAFVRVFGDNYFVYEKDKLKEKIKEFLLFGLENAKKSITTSVFVPAEKVLSASKAEKSLFNFAINENGKISLVDEYGKIAITSITVEPPTIIDLLKELKQTKASNILDIHSQLVRNILIKQGKFYGFVINDIEAFLNVNTPDDYLKTKEISGNVRKEKIKYL
jgi:NDP-sugar pyrophosphorylase family protein